MGRGGAKTWGDDKKAQIRQLVRLILEKSDDMECVTRTLQLIAQGSARRGRETFLRYDNERVEAISSLLNRMFRERSEEDSESDDEEVDDCLEAPISQRDLPEDLQAVTSTANSVVSDASPQSTTSQTTNADFAGLLLNTPSPSSLPHTVTRIPSTPPTSSPQEAGCVSPRHSGVLIKLRDEVRDMQVPPGLPTPERVREANARFVDLVDNGLLQAEVSVRGFECKVTVLSPSGPLGARISVAPSRFNSDECILGGASEYAMLLFHPTKVAYQQQDESSSDVWVDSDEPFLEWPTAPVDTVEHLWERLSRDSSATLASLDALLASRPVVSSIPQQPLFDTAVTFVVPWPSKWTYKSRKRVRSVLEREDGQRGSNSTFEVITFVASYVDPSCQPEPTAQKIPLQEYF